MHTTATPQSSTTALLEADGRIALETWDRQHPNATDHPEDRHLLIEVYGIAAKATPPAASV